MLTDFSMVKVQGRDELDEICVPHPSREDIYNKIRMQRVGVRLGEGAKVVLSACNLGRGKIKAECMVGLAQGFLLGRVARCRRPRLAMLRLARRPADRPACVRKGCGRRAAGGVEAANALGRLSCHGRKHAPPPRRRLPSASLAAQTHHPAPHFVIRSTVWSILPAS